MGTYYNDLEAIIVFILGMFGGIFLLAAFEGRVSQAFFFGALYFIFAIGFLFRDKPEHFKTKWYE